VLSYTNESADNCKHTLGRIFWVVSGIFNLPIDFFTQGLSDFLCLETLRHGTSWDDYIKIRMYGADPRIAEKRACKGFELSAQLSGSKDRILAAKTYWENSENKIFMYRDSTVGTDFSGHKVDIFKRFEFKDRGMIGHGVVTDREFSIFKKCLMFLHIRFAPRLYAWKAGIVLNEDVLQKDLISTIKRIVSGIFNLLCPTVNFRFLPEDVKMPKFKDDPLLLGGAIYTEEHIATDYIGIKGVFIQGVKGNLTQRIKNNPCKSIWGLIKLINPIGVFLIVGFGLYLLNNRGLSKKCTNLSAIPVGS